MTTTTTLDGVRRTPWHLWVVGVLSLLWNSFGCVDYLMSHIQGETWLRNMGMTQPQIDYYNAMSDWMTAVWALGVWGGALGSVLLLMRSRWAAPVFGVSLAAYVLSLVYSYALSNGREVFGGQMFGMNLVILAACIFFAWYAWRMTKAGVLR